MSRDIPDSCRETSRTTLGPSRALRPARGLVGLRGVQGQLPEQLAVFGDDPDVEVVDQQQNLPAGVDPADADVEQLAAVAQRLTAALVDAVLADPVVTPAIR